MPGFKGIFRVDIQEQGGGNVLAHQGWLEGYADEYSGWEKETTGPTFDWLLHHQGDDASKLNRQRQLGC